MEHQDKRMQDEYCRLGDVHDYVLAAEVLLDGVLWEVDVSL